jgi:hypothetical protein
VGQGPLSTFVCNAILLKSKLRLALFNTRIVPPFPSFFLSFSFSFLLLFFSFLFLFLFLFFYGRSTTANSQSRSRWLVKGFGREELVKRGESSQTIHVIHEQSASPAIGMDKTDLRKWPAYYDSPRSALPDSTNAAAMLGTPTATTGGIIAGLCQLIHRRTEKPPLSKIRGHRRTRSLSLFFLKHPSYSGCSVPQRRPSLCRTRCTIFDSCHVR